MVPYGTQYLAPHAGRVPYGTQYLARTVSKGRTGP